MALSRPLRLAGLFVFAGLLATGCAAGPAAGPASHEPSLGQEAARSRDRETFPRTAAVLRDEIDEKAGALRDGPIGNRARELASLRLAASGRELLVSGSLDGALVSLQKAVSLYGANGYAYLFLASVHQAEGRPGQAREFVASARRYLPRDKGVEAELDGLARSLEEGRPRPDSR